MTLFRLVLLLLLLWGGSASRPRIDASRHPAQAALDCLQPGTWGNDWPLCGRVPVLKKSRGEPGQRVDQELKLKLRNDGTGEMSFFFCPTQQRIPRPVQFAYRISGDRLQFTWSGTPEDIRLVDVSFNHKTSFTARCSQDTLFIDSLLTTTMYRGATYFIRRN